jgi:hypothetical protein
MIVRIPFFRLGLLLIVGSVFASIFTFYVDLGGRLSDMTGEAPSTEKRDLWAHFRDHFLFAGTVPGVLFWIGAALGVIGVLRIGSSRRSPGRAARNRPST